MLKIIGFDLDGTLTQHRTPLPPASRELLDRLRPRYRVLIVGAGNCPRILRQIENYPIDVIGNYGMQYCRYDPDAQIHRQIFDLQVSPDRESVADRISRLRQEHGYTEFVGEGVEFHSSGCVTFPLLGTRADIRDKLAFDPDRKKRLAFYSEVCELFPEFTVFVGGSSSFDLAPLPYNKSVPSGFRLYPCLFVPFGLALVLVDTDEQIVYNLSIVKKFCVLLPKEAACYADRQQAIRRTLYLWKRT